MKGIIIFALLWAGTLFAGEADVTNVTVKKTGDGIFTFSVTLKHADTGWDHYADRWEVLAPDGTVLATRVLTHPHVNEQPFTRSLSGISIPPEITEVTVRGRDSVHGYGGEVLVVEIPLE